MKNMIKTDLIIDFMKTNKLSKSQFCRLCGMSSNIFDKIMYGNYNFYVTVLLRLSDTIGVSMSEIFNE